MRTMKRIASLLLAIIMTVSICPISVFADEEPASSPAEDWSVETTAAPEPDTAAAEPAAEVDAEPAAEVDA